MALSGLKIGQTVAHDLVLWTVWSQSATSRHWFLYRHPETHDAPTGFREVSQSRMFRTVADEARHLDERAKKAAAKAGVST